MTNDATAPRIRLDVVRAGRVVASSPGRSMTFGRDPACDVCLPDPHISTRHGEIFFAGQRAVYQDLKSRNGSQVRRGPKTIAVDATIGHQCPIENGDELLLGNPLEPIVLHVRLGRPASPAEQAEAAGDAQQPTADDEAFVEKNVKHAEPVRRHRHDSESGRRRQAGAAVPVQPAQPTDGDLGPRVDAAGGRHPAVRVVRGGHRRDGLPRAEPVQHTVGLRPGREGRGQGEAPATSSRCSPCIGRAAPRRPARSAGCCSSA